jgi:hypothetical protein
MSYHRDNMLKLTFLFFLFYAFSGQGQGVSDAQRKCLETQYYGTNDMMVNGRHYQPEHPMATGHPYFQTDLFTQGKLFVRGRVYDQVELLYNVERDQLILKKQLTNNNMVQIIASAALLDSFTFHDQLFINKRLLDFKKDEEGYLKKLFRNNWQLYLQVEKDYYPVFSDKHPYGRYGKLTQTYYLIDDKDVVFRFKSRRSFLKMFGKKKKKEVKRYMKKLDMRFTKASDRQWSELMKFCEKLHE